MTILLDKIDTEKAEWLLLCAPYIERNYQSTFFIEYLIEFEDSESIKWIGKIYLKILEYATPTFKEENIQLLVDRIYKKGDWKDAETICDTYGRRGVHFLKGVWEANQRIRQEKTA